MNKNFTLRLLVLLVLLGGIIGAVSAQVRPAMSVYVRWTPNSQLDTDLGDERFARLNIYAAGNVSFWAANIRCTIGTGTQVSLTQPNSDAEYNAIFGATWGDIGNADYVVTSSNVGGNFYTGNVLAFTVSRIGSTTSNVGINGQDNTQLIASLNFRVTEQSANVLATVSCTSMDFLDRDGNTVIRGRFSRLNDLQILTGYTLTGVAQRQGTRAHQNIAVTCVQDDDRDFNTTGDQTSYGPVFTSSTGAFSFTSTTLLRTFGLYRCTFQSQFVQGVPNTQILSSQIYFDLQTTSYALQPIVLRGGDVADDGVIDMADISTITGAYNSTSAPYETSVTGIKDGETNGDTFINQIDLTITAGNFGITTVSGNHLPDHVVYSLGRDLPTNIEFPNSKLWLGNSENGNTVAMDSRSRTRDFWGQVSPNGSTTVFVSEDARSGFHSLATLTNGRTLPIRFPRGWVLEAFAPAWTPDGQVIAFVCSAQNDFLRNRGSICMINNGDRLGSSLLNLNLSSRIHPPTFMVYDTDAITTGIQAGYVMLYGGTDGLIHYYDLVDGQSGILAVDNGGSDIVDMPVITNYLFDGANYLSYRFSAAGTTDPILKLGTLSYDGTNFTGGVLGAVNGVTHVNVPNSTGLGFYDVAPNLDILFYQEHLYGNNLAFNLLDHVDGAPLTWAAPYVYFVDSAIGNPTTDDNGAIWNGDYERRTELHIHRMSFDFIP